MKTKHLLTAVALGSLAMILFSGESFAGEVSNLGGANQEALNELNTSINDTIKAGFYYGKRVAGGAGLIMMMVGAIFRQNPMQTLVGLGTFAGALGIPKFYDVFIDGGLLPF